MGFEALREMTNHRITATGRQSRHIEQTADLLSAASDMGRPNLLAATLVERGQAHQGRNLMAVELTQFGQVGQQHGAGMGAHPRQAAQDTVLVSEVIVGLDVLLDEFVQPADLVFEGLDHFTNTFADLEVAAHGGTVDFLGEQRGELSTTSNQFSESVDIGVGGRFGGRFDHLTEVGDHVGIDRVGFGQASHATGEVADLAGIGNDHRLAGLDEFSGEGSFITTAGLHHKELDVLVAQVPEQLLMALTSVRIGALDLGGSRGDHKGLFGDIDTEDKCWRHGVLPFLPMRASQWAAQAAVRVRSIGATRTMLGDGLSDHDTTGLTSPFADDSARCAMLRQGLRYARLAVSKKSYGTANHV